MLRINLRNSIFLFLLILISFLLIKPIKEPTLKVLAQDQAVEFKAGFNIPDYAYPSARSPNDVVVGLEPLVVTNSWWDPDGGYGEQRWQLNNYGIEYLPKVISQGTVTTIGLESFTFETCADSRIINWLEQAIPEGWNKISETALSHPGSIWFAPPHEPQNTAEIEESKPGPDWLTFPEAAVCLTRKFVKTVQSADPSARLWFPTLMTAEPGYSNQKWTAKEWLSRFSTAEDTLPHVNEFDVNLKQVAWEGLALDWFPGPAGCGTVKYDPICLLNKIQSDYYPLVQSYPWIHNYIAFAELGITHGADNSCSPTSEDCVANWVSQAWTQMENLGFVKVAIFYTLDLSWWSGANSNHGLCKYNQSTKLCPWTKVGQAFYNLPYSPILPTTTPTPTSIPKPCITEGNIGSYFNNDTCCSELSLISNAWPYENNCVSPTNGSFICARCPNQNGQNGDGVCGPGENYCNCPAECPETTPTPTPPAHCQPLGDIDCSGKVNALDLSILLSKFGSADPQSDLDDSGKVNALDLSILLSNFGRST